MSKTVYQKTGGTGGAALALPFAEVMQLRQWLQDQGLASDDISRQVQAIDDAYLAALKVWREGQNRSPKGESSTLELPIQFGETEITTAYLKVIHRLNPGRLRVNKIYSGRSGKQQNYRTLRARFMDDGTVKLETGGATETIIPVEEWRAIVDKMDVQIHPTSKTTLELTPEIIKMARDVAANRRKAPTDKEWAAELVAMETDEEITDKEQKTVHAQYDYHEYANLFPMMDSDEKERLRESMQEHGFLPDEPIVLYEGKILDGRNRYVRALEVGVDPVFVEYEGDDPLGYVIAKNRDRRHLTSSQLATIATDLLPLLEKEAAKRSGQRTDLDPNLRQKFDTGSGGRATEQAAEALGTNRQYVHDAQTLKDEDPELFVKVQAGEISIGKAKKILTSREFTVGDRVRSKSGAYGTVDEIKPDTGTLMVMWDDGIRSAEGPQAVEKVEPGATDMHWLARYRELSKDGKIVAYAIGRSGNLLVAFERHAVGIAALLDSQAMVLPDPSSDRAGDMVHAVKVHRLHAPSWDRLTQALGKDMLIYESDDGDLKSWVDTHITETAELKVSVDAPVPGLPSAGVDVATEAEGLEGGGQAVNAVDPAMTEFYAQSGDTTGTNEWYTPPHIIERVTQVFGDVIDLDPASCEAADEIVGANHIFTAEDDGLSKDWTAESVFLNPPYGNEIGAFVDKAVSEWEAGHYNSGILLLKAATETQYFEQLAPFPKCFLRGRLKFWGPGDQGNSATFASVIVGINVDVDVFAEAFGELGEVMVPYGYEVAQPTLKPVAVDDLTHDHVIDTMDAADDPVGAGLEMFFNVLNAGGIVINAMESWADDDDRTDEESAIVQRIVSDWRTAAPSLMKRTSNLKHRPGAFLEFQQALMDAETEADLLNLEARLREHKTFNTVLDAPLEALQAEINDRRSQMRADGQQQEAA